MVPTLKGSTFTAGCGSPTLRQVPDSAVETLQRPNQVIYSGREYVRVSVCGRETNREQEKGRGRENLLWER